MLHEALTYDILGAFFHVHSTLGHGYVESVYARAMMCELAHRSIPACAEVAYPVRYRGRTVGEFRADIVVANCVLLELKAVDRLAVAHQAQVINYLRASGLSVGLLLNFGARAERKRLIWTRGGPAADDLQVMRPPRRATPAIP